MPFLPMDSKDINSCRKEAGLVFASNPATFFGVAGTVIPVAIRLPADIRWKNWNWLRANFLLDPNTLDPAPGAMLIFKTNYEVP